MAEPAYGGFWIRFLAYLVDSVIFFTLLCLLVLLAALGVAGGAGDSLMKLVALLCAVGPLLYWGLMQASPRQATFGKALLGLKVAGPDGERLSIARSLAREVAKIVSAIPLMIGFLLAAFTGRKQALHDIVASTTVVRAERGHLMVGLVLGLFGWLAPIALVMVVGVGMFAAMIGMQTASLQQARKEAVVPKVASTPSSASKPQAPPATLAGFPERPGMVRAGPAILELGSNFGDNFWLQVKMPAGGEYGASKASLVVSHVVDSKGGELYDPSHNLEKEFFQQVPMGSADRPIRHQNATRTVHLRKGANGADLQRVDGTLKLEVPVNPLAVSFGPADVGKTQTVHGNTATLNAFNEKEAEVRFGGEWSNLVSVTGYGADGHPVPTGMGPGAAGAPKITFQQPAARLEVTFAQGRRHEEFPFSLTKTSTPSASATPSPPAAPPSASQPVAEAKPVTSRVEPIKVLRIVRYQPDADTGARMGDAKALAGYVKAIERPILKAGAGLKGGARVFGVAAVVKPTGATRMWLIPPLGDGADVASLYRDVERDLAAIKAPKPRGGPIGFAVVFSVDGGDSQDPLPVPPSWQEIARKAQPTTFDAMVQAVWPEPRPAPAVAAAVAPPTEEAPSAPAAKAEAPVLVPIPAGPVRPAPRFNDVMTAVLYADTQAVSDLVELGRWVDKPDSHGMTPLTAAAMLGDLKTAEVLLKAGANPEPALPMARERHDAAMTTLLERYTK